MKELLCLSKNGKKIFIDVASTNISLHILENENLLELVREAVEKSDISGAKVALEIDLGRVIGTTSMVEITKQDEVVWAKRIDRDKYSKFVKHRQLQPTCKVVAILFQEENGYLLWSGWCGELLPQESDGNGGMRTSREFHKTHALVYDEKIIQKDTITTTRPR